MSRVHVSTEDLPYRVSLRSEQHQWLADEPLELGGGDTGPTPTQLLLSSLGACTAITLKMYATRKKWPLTRVNIDLTLNPDGKPASGTAIRRTLHLEGELDESQRARLLQIANACPVHKLLAGEVHLESLLDQ